MWASHDDISPVAAISLDAQKTFDRVEWHYLLFTLDCFGFSKKCIDWIRLIYAQPAASVLTNGLISFSFHLGGDKRQGDSAPQSVMIRRKQALKLRIVVISCFCKWMTYFCLSPTMNVFSKSLLNSHLLQVKRELEKVWGFSLLSILS